MKYRLTIDLIGQQYACNESNARSRETLYSALEKIRKGFCLKSILTVAERSHIVETYPEAATIRIDSVRLRGGRHYSIHELLGHSVNGLVFVVVDFESFKSEISARLEKDFLRKNPEPDAHVRSAFTSFMHNNKLHWSRCCGQSAGSERSNEEVSDFEDRVDISGSNEEFRNAIPVLSKGEECITNFSW